MSRPHTIRQSDIVTASPAETKRYGRHLATLLKPGDILLLVGPLGSGKTTLVKGIAAGLGIAQPIVSPTFVLRKQYPTTRGAITMLHHLDAYRLETTEELRGLLDEEFQDDQTAVWCIEWGKKLRGKLPSRRLLVLSIEYARATRRRLKLKGLREQR